ncbi:MAG: Lrp/AsnC family transcriptional regulator [Alicyclobacillus sp.]|nr:Lrp/AsnC family transcriptional regulator [Alicyclobacillus sp.]
MKLTERRRQFLKQLIDLYQRTQLPVHYESLAKVIGVSKWTAYDMLKELEKLGFLVRDYAVPHGEVGRSQIVFFPTQKAHELFQQERIPQTDFDEWVKVRSHILDLIDSAKEPSPKETIQVLMNHLANTSTRLSFCSYVLGLLLVYVRHLDKSTSVLIRNFIERISDPQTRLTVFVSLVLGTVIQATQAELSIEFVNLIGRFWEELTALPSNEKILLSRFLDETSN